MCMLKMKLSNASKNYTELSGIMTGKMGHINIIMSAKTWTVYCIYNMNLFSHSTCTYWSKTSASTNC